MKTISTFIDYILTSCTAYNSANTVFIKSQDTGESDDIAVSGEDLYPRVFLQQPFQITYNQNLNYINCQLVVLDKHKVKDLPDINYRLTLTFQILNDLIEKFKTDNTYVLDPNFSTVSVTYFTGDICAGWIADLTFKQAIQVERCKTSDRFYLPHNSYDAYFEVYPGYESQNHLMNLYVNGTFYSPPPSSLFLDNISGLTSYLNSLDFHGVWDVYYDSENNIHFRISYTDAIPDSIRIFQLEYAAPASTIFTLI